MTKAELVNRLVQKSSLTKHDASVVVQTVLDSIINSLQDGEKVELRGFGSFKIRVRGPRKGRNPKTGETVDVPGKKIPYFKPGKELRDLINS
ncbi:MAG TPA: integration host factor subunit beta [Acidobacteriota bacterium]|jgi:integration host factor subunit beta|nr:integration host factor subunit beta [Acidobacteriota bacterium]HOO21939.1 integration host factor subunit beta [Kiritimatiellia bacterium]HNR38951.1 integration host factor subunit beta [Acidobacteriota bacterium]HNU00877.1 integration host factor subunit beta [Acidobacteriota bacterium]HOB51461.1 integration host factor subunit beta [Acidobacteriota bacterium]